MKLTYTARKAEIQPAGGERKAEEHNCLNSAWGEGPHSCILTSPIKRAINKPMKPITFVKGLLQKKTKKPNLKYNHFDLTGFAVTIKR